ncbi:ArgE/DapE family deacylase [Enterococcus rivorum]|uniref:Probable succinyl-diaminopimelate desuccinylase n=1 Tax=Enterococcus rivorum TaxID=762845 RepID=A0A1E5KSG6_9ENTE|nr:ArgE/DapE family deacylase [Enterococcus rivorum]MBP2097367.1 succinyl-diaminopimelate desuccinylase [Enterococcus rivorum]OEH80718.1 succinyl-diaminopimelate desuccinylase [Enterococcus rivorum]
MEKAEKITILKDLIAIPTVNGQEEKIADYIQKLFTKYNISSEKVLFSENRANLVAEIGNGNGKVLGLSGHMDVVDPGNLEEWNYPPFDPTIEDDKLYGRGSTDMKSGLAAMVIAMIELIEEKSTLNGTLKLLASVGEEIGELGAEQLTKKGYIDNLDALIVGEPTNLALVYTHKGSIDYTITSHGKAAHSSMPELGINAINNMVVCINAINSKMTEISKLYSDPETGQVTHNITIINGGVQVNSIPDKTVIQGNIRTIPAYGNERVRKDIQTIVDQLNQQKNFKLKLTFDYDKLPVKSNKNSFLVQIIQKVHHEKYSEDLPLEGIAATTDVAEYIKADKPFDFIILGPGEGTLAHQFNEYVEIQNFLDVIDMYKKIAQEYLNS